MGSATLHKSGVAMSLLIIVHATLCAIQRTLDTWTPRPHRARWDSL